MCLAWNLIFDLLLVCVNPNPAFESLFSNKSNGLGFKGIIRHKSVNVKSHSEILGLPSNTQPLNLSSIASISQRKAESPSQYSSSSSTSSTSSPSSLSSASSNSEPQTPLFNPSSKPPIIKQISPSKSFYMIKPESKVLSSVTLRAVQAVKLESPDSTEPPYLKYLNNAKKSLKQVSGEIEKPFSNAQIIDTTKPIEQPKQSSDRFENKTNNPKPNSKKLENIYLKISLNFWPI